MERLIYAKPPVEDRAKYLMEIANGFERGQIFLTALELEVFTRLQKFQTAKALSSEINTHPDLTMRFLDVLAALGLLDKDGDNYRTVPNIAPFVVEDSPYAARYLKFGIKSRKTWMRLREILENGPTGEAEDHKHNYDQKCIDWMARGTMLGRLQATVKQVREFPEFAGARKLIDLGGGHGLFGIGFAQENPKLSVVIFDKPEVTSMTREYIDRYGVGDRVKTMSGDYTKDDIGSGYDIAFEACSFGGSDDDQKSFYRQVWRALKDEGMFIRLTFTLNDERTEPLSSLIWDLREHMTGHGHMHMRTNSELFKILGEAGLVGERVIDMAPWCSMPMRMVISRKKDKDKGSSALLTKSQITAQSVNG